MRVIRKTLARIAEVLLEGIVLAVSIVLALIGSKSAEARAA